MIDAPAIVARPAGNLSVEPCMVVQGLRDGAYRKAAYTVSCVKPGLGRPLVPALEEVCV